MTGLSRELFPPKPLGEQADDGVLGPRTAASGRRTSQTDNARTRWSSAFSDEQWIQSISVHRRPSIASSFTGKRPMPSITSCSCHQISWTEYSVATVINGNGGVDEFEGEGVFNDDLPPVRYVRLNLQQRATQWAAIRCGSSTSMAHILENQPPVVTLTSSSGPHDTTRVPPLIPLRADASDPDGTIAKASEFWENDGLVATDHSRAAYAFDWTNVPAGHLSNRCCRGRQWRGSQWSARKQPRVTVAVRPATTGRPTWR